MSMPYGGASQVGPQMSTAGDMKVEGIYQDEPSDLNIPEKDRSKGT